MITQPAKLLAKVAAVMIVFFVLGEFLFPH